VDVLLAHPQARPSRTGNPVKVEHRQKDVDVDSFEPRPIETVFREQGTRGDRINFASNRAERVDD
jgi:hypothetical protein